MKKDISIDNLRGVMLFGIFVYHSLTILSYINTPQFIPLHIQVSLTQCLSRTLGTFFLISGYFAIKPNTATSRQEWLNLLRHRFTSLGIPYLMWNAIYILFFLAGGLLFPVVAMRVQELGLTSPKGILGAWLGIWTRPANGPFWYVRDIYYLIVLSPIIVFMAKRGVYSILIIIISCLVLPFIQPHIPIILPAPYEIIAFSFGVFMRFNSKSLHIFEERLWLGVTCAFLCLVTVSGNIAWKPFVWLCGMTGLEYLIMIPTCLSLLKVLTFQEDTLFYRLITKPSFFVFAAHGLCASTVLRIVAPYLPPSPIHGVILVVLYVIGGCLLIYPAYFILGKWMPGLMSLLLGGR